MDSTHLTVVTHPPDLYLEMEQMLDHHHDIHKNPVAYIANLESVGIREKRNGRLGIQLKIFATVLHKDYWVLAQLLVF